MLEYTWQPRKTLINTGSTVTIRDLDQNVVTPPQAPVISGRNVTIYVAKEGRYFVTIKSQTASTTHRIDVNDTSNDTGPGITTPLEDPQRPGTFMLGGERILGEEELVATYAPISVVPTRTHEALDVSRSVALRPWHTALANRDYAKANAVFWGTSMTEGGPMVTTGRDRRWMERLTRTLRARYPLASQPVGSTGYIPAFYQSFTVGGTAQYGLITPTGVTYSGDHLETGAGLGARTIELDSSGDWIEFSFTGTGADIHLASRAVASSSGTVSIDGGATIAANIPTGTNASAIQQIRSLTAGSHTVRITWSSGQVGVSGLYPYNGDESKGIHVYDAGKGSAQASAFANAAPFRLNSTIQPALVGIEYGYNEFFANVSVATFKTNLQNVTTNALANITKAPTCLFIVWQQPSDTTPATAPYSDYVNAIKEVAAATPNGIVVDFRDRFPAATSPNVGLWGWDLVHLSDTGSAYVADVLNEVLAPK